jgi:hypothetical protein
VGVEVSEAEMAFFCNGDDGPIDEDEDGSGAEWSFARWFSMAIDAARGLVLVDCNCL